jgi:hypothetical protein
MKEEHERLIEAEKVYRRSVGKAIQGSPRIKHIGNKDYLYLEKRDGRKVVYYYIGPAGNKKSIEILEIIKHRRKDQISLKKIRNDLKDVKKVLRGKI